jgi:hypothetical protein
MLTESQKKANAKWRSRNPEKIKAYRRNSYQRHKVSISMRGRISREVNKEKIAERKKKDYIVNCEHIKKRVYRRKKERLKTDPVFRMKENLRRRIHKAIKTGYGIKANKTHKLLGAPFEVVHEHLTNLFKPGMTWENYGSHTWHIDHIKPCASFDLTTLTQQKACFHYTNLQPLWAYDNLRKSAKLTFEIS